MAVDACFAQLLADRRNEMRRPPSQVTMSQVRAAASAFLRQNSARRPVARIDESTLSGPGNSALAVRIYRPVDADVLPAVVFCHGGGFVFGDLDTHDGMCRELAVQSGCAVVAVDYRLAPEHQFPSAVEDCLAAIRHVIGVAPALGLNSGALALVGESAGGHIAIGAALMAKTEAIVLRHVALIYPVIDLRCDSQSMHEFAKGYLLTREAIQWFWECYVPEASTRADPRVALLAADLHGFPPATIITGEFDPLRDEGEMFAMRLRAAQVPVEVHRYAGMIHGFAGMPQLTLQAAHAVNVAGRAIACALSDGPS